MAKRGARDGVPARTRAGQALLAEGGVTNTVLALCCTDQQPGVVRSPRGFSCEANVFRPPKLEHPVQRGDSNGHLGREDFRLPAVTSRIANALGVELITAEATRPSGHHDALDYILRGRGAWNKGPSRDNYAQAISLFERALALDPRSVDAQSWLVSALATRATSQLTDSAAADIARAEALIRQVLAASPRSALAHYAKGQMLRTQGRYEEAIPEYETALALNRNLVSALNGLGWCKLSAGTIDEVIPLQEQAIRLSPRDPRIGWYHFLIGTVHLLQSHTDEAIVWLEKARSAVPAVPIAHSNLAAAYALSGDLDRAANELAEARRLRGEGSLSSISKMKAGGGWSSLSPKARSLFETTYFAGLRKAGMPKE